MDPQQRPRIVALGDLVVDIVASAAGPLAHGSDRAGTIVFRQGGSAANTARWIARCGGQAVFVGAIGGDVWGRRLATSLAPSGDIRTRSSHCESLTVENLQPLTINTECSARWPAPFWHTWHAILTERAEQPLPYACQVSWIARNPAAMSSRHIPLN